MTGWTHELKELAKREYLDGKSASQVAKLLNTAHGCFFSRNAVISILNRQGVKRGANAAGVSSALSGRLSHFKAPPVPRARKVAPVPKAGPAMAATPLPRPASISADPLRLTLTQLGARQCRWPVEESPNGQHLFCGRGRSGEGPYCPAHARIAYDPAGTAQSNRKAERSIARWAAE